MRAIYTVFLCFLTLELYATKDLSGLYASLDSFSVAKQLAFAKIYRNSEEGQLARSRAWFLLSGSDDEPPQAIDELMIDRSSVLLFDNEQREFDQFSNGALLLIEELSKSLDHHRLKGKNLCSIEEILALEDDQVDLSRLLFLAMEIDFKKIREYEAYLDLMALQIKAQLKKLGVIVGQAQNCKELEPTDVIDAINSFVFVEKRFLFPPLSVFEKQIDQYTFLDAVLERGRGVCLGISSLYLCLAQRLGLELEIITPPGHIYLSYTKSGDPFNIETTRRGVHIPSEQYLRLDLKFLPKRCLKEIPGLHFFNQAGLFWQNKEYEKALAAYEKAMLYTPQDPLTKQFYAYYHLSLRKKNQALSMLSALKPFDYLIYQDTEREDLLKGLCDIEVIENLHGLAHESLQALLDQEKKLLEIIKGYPKFRSAYFYLAMNYLQTHRYGKAREVLQEYHSIDENNPLVEYYLSLLHREVLDYKSAWEHCSRAEALLKDHKELPKGLCALKRNLAFLYPDHR